MNERIQLLITENGLVLVAAIDCPSLRIYRHPLEFFIDTGSPYSFLSEIAVKKFQIPIKEKQEIGEIDFGGSRFKQISLPKIKMYTLKEGKDNKEYFTFEVSLSALKTTKLSEKKIQAAQALPSILGLDFLKEQKLSLHVILTENIAYLQFEG